MFKYIVYALLFPEFAPLPPLEIQTQVWLSFTMAFKSYLLSALAVLSSISTVHGAANALTGPVANFGTNPSNVTMYLYLPTVLQSNPPVLVNPHWCHGSAQAAFTGTQLATLADTYGYIMIFPNSPNTVDMCWDVSSNATLTHNGGGDSLGIVSMVKYVLVTYGGDPNRVFSIPVRAL